MNRGLPPWQRECMQGTEQAGEMCSGTNTEADVKNTSWANTFFLARKRTLRLDPSPCFHVETGVAEPPGSTQGSRVEDSYGSRDEVFLHSQAEPGGCSDPRGTAAPSHPRLPWHTHPARFSCTSFGDCTWVQSSPRTGVH